MYAQTGGVRQQKSIKDIIHLLEYKLVEIDGICVCFLYMYTYTVILDSVYCARNNKRKRIVCGIGS